MSCLRCGKCCETNPCEVSGHLYLEMIKEFPELKMVKNPAYLGSKKPAKKRGICIYYEKIDGKANCKLCGYSKSFKKSMIDGSETFACSRERN